MSFLVLLQLLNTQKHIKSKTGVKTNISAGPLGAKLQFFLAPPPASNKKRYLETQSSMLKR